MKVDIYSDVVCPWCYIGERRFARALEAFEAADDVEVQFRAFQLDPSAPETAVPLNDYLEARYGPRASGMLERVSEVAAGEGITIDWDGAQSVNTRSAHRLLTLARHEHGSEVQGRLLERLFDLYFTRGGDVGDHEVLVELAGSVGMDQERARTFLASEEGTEDVDSDIASARSLGISGVPTFVFDGEFAVSGAQPVSTLLRALEQMHAKATSAASAGSTSANGPSCDDGVCDV